MFERTTLLMLAVVVGGFALLLAVLPVPRATSSAVSAGSDGGAPPLVIDNVRYFDGRRLQPPADLLLQGGRVRAIGADLTVPADAERIDGAGLTALPGLVDAHVHTFGSARRDALRFGVTSLIDMFTAPANLAGMRASRDAYPRTDEAALFSAGMLATAAGGHGTQFGVDVDTLDSPADAPDWVAGRLAEGSDFVKLVYTPHLSRRPSLDLPTARAVIEAAHAAGVMAVAHIASRAGAADLLTAGIDGLVHVFADEPADEAFVTAARDRGIFVIPTLSVLAMASGASTGPALLGDPALATRLDPLARANLARDYGGRVPGVDLEVAIENVRRLHAAGVPILAGSDAPNPGTAHGITLHGELDLLVRAGLSPAEALAAATSVPARLFGAEGRGVLAPGARADVLLVRGDPTTDIRATRRLELIVRNGYPLQPRVPEAASAAATDVTRVPLPEALGDFDGGIEAPRSLVWAPTSDARMGGTSDARLRHLPDGGGGALGVRARVGDGFAYPWAGAWLGVARDGSVGDLSRTRAISFRVRGTPASYRLMLFEQDGYGAPPTVAFEVTEDWRRVEIPLAQFGGFTPSRFTGMAFVTPMRAGEYDFALDEVRLVRRPD